MTYLKFNQAKKLICNRTQIQDKNDNIGNDILME